LLQRPLVDIQLIVNLGQLDVRAGYGGCEHETRGESVNPRCRCLVEGGSQCRTVLAPEVELVAEIQCQPAFGLRAATERGRHDVVVAEPLAGCAEVRVRAGKLLCMDSP